MIRSFQIFCASSTKTVFRLLKLSSSFSHETLAREMKLWLLLYYNLLLLILIIQDRLCVRMSAVTYTDEGLRLEYLPHISRQPPLSFTVLNYVLSFSYHWYPISYEHPFWYEWYIYIYIQHFERLDYRIPTSIKLWYK